MAEAKAAVEAASGLPAARQAVLFAGEELSDERTLASYAVGEYGQDVSLGVQLRPAPLAVFIGSACGHSLRCVRLDPAEEVGLLPGLLVAAHCCSSLLSVAARCSSLPIVVGHC